MVRYFSLEVLDDTTLQFLVKLIFLKYFRNGLIISSTLFETSAILVINPRQDLGMFDEEEHLEDDPYNSSLSEELLPDPRNLSKWLDEFSGTDLGRVGCWGK